MSAPFRDGGTDHDARAARPIVFRDDLVSGLENAGFMGVAARDFVPGVLVRVSGTKLA